MAGFSVESFDLSLIDSTSGNPLQANYYTVDGIYETTATGETRLRQLSIGQLVMAICLEQAVALEDDIVKIMNNMAVTIQKLEVLTGIQETIINNPDAKGNLCHKTLTYDLSNWPGGSITSEKSDWSTTYNFLVNEVKCTGITDKSSSQEVISAVSSALDDLNTVNQRETIDLESYTNKRDQRYDLISNVLKSFNNVLVSIANNI